MANYGKMCLVLSLLIISSMSDYYMTCFNINSYKSSLNGILVSWISTGCTEKRNLVCLDHQQPACLICRLQNKQEPQTLTRSHRGPPEIPEAFTEDSKSVQTSWRKKKTDQITHQMKAQTQQRNRLRSSSASLTSFDKKKKNTGSQLWKRTRCIRGRCWLSRPQSSASQLFQRKSEPRSWELKTSNFLQNRN